ncbi:TetR/AcrR family transcriptional regulator [Antrihabitans cavernicola]|uniref:TetR/AcrR family transcriptional regulator n=1 Tax=Antrihabitans cavernicola TaxID=2495913 RepID=A0A5A7S093_9NOCA|nr:TetR/AcrR family transcriptional regulator [Spelaeibacter cavernicola]KAA0015872.1 TetR/AcrR family transcriptional regulator [Spelaeibacter cavernicola]
MSTPYEASGRTRQKQRTRAALTDAARTLVASGITPTIDDVADATGISRAVVYRYFPNRLAMLAAAHPFTGRHSLLPDDPPGDPAARLEIVVDTLIRIVLDTEAQQRTMLRLSLEAAPTERADLPLRRGRAIGWIAEALAPLHAQLSEHAVHRLVLAVRSAVGIEALVWLTDVAGLDSEAAAALMSWSAQAMLHAALTSAPPTG